MLEDASSPDGAADIATDGSSGDVSLPEAARPVHDGGDGSTCGTPTDMVTDQCVPTGRCDSCEAYSFTYVCNAPIFARPDIAGGAHVSDVRYCCDPS